MSDTSRYDIAQNGRYQPISLTLRVLSYIPVVEYYQLNQGCLPVLLAHYLAAPAPEQAGEKEKAARPSSRPCSRSSSSSLPAPPASQRSSSPTSAKMAASEAASEADSAMSQVGPELQHLITPYQPSPCHCYFLCLHFLLVLF